MLKKLNINVSKIDKGLMVVKEKRTYLNLVLFENKGGKDRYGNDGFIAQEVSKEQREAGIQGPIVGNWKCLEPLNQTPAKHEEEQYDDDDIPF